jgi:hypothetical protein
MGHNADITHQIQHGESPGSKSPIFYFSPKGRKKAMSSLRLAAIPNATVPIPKRDLKNMSGVLSAGKKRGPSPSFFPPPPHPPSLGLFSAPYAMEAPQKKRKVKNGQMLIRKEEPRLIAFDHFFEFEIAVRLGRQVKGVGLNCYFFSALYRTQQNPFGKMFLQERINA